MPKFLVAYHIVNRRIRCAEKMSLDLDLAAHGRKKKWTGSLYESEFGIIRTPRIRLVIGDAVTCLISRAK